MSDCVLCNSVFVVIFFKKMYMYNKTTNVTRLSFCDIGNNQGLGK